MLSLFFLHTSEYQDMANINITAAIIINTVTIYNVQEYTTTLLQMGWMRRLALLHLCVCVCVWRERERENFKTGFLCMTTPNPGWPKTQRLACHCLPSAATKHMCHRTPLPYYIQRTPRYKVTETVSCYRIKFSKKTTAQNRPMCLIISQIN